MTDPVLAAQAAGIGDARRLFPATASRAYFNTAAVGLASLRLADTYHQFIDEWTATGFDYSRGEQAAGGSIGGGQADRRRRGRYRADPVGVLGGRASGGPVRRGLPGPEHRDRAAGVQLEPLPLAPAGCKGYDVRQVPFRNGGLEPDDVAGGGRWHPAGRVQRRSVSDAATAPHRRDQRPGPNGGGDRFVDGSQMIGAVPVSGDLQHVDVLVAPDHKFLLNAGRGICYCYLSPAVQRRFTPVSAGWRVVSVSTASSAPR